MICYENYSQQIYTQVVCSSSSTAILSTRAQKLVERTQHFQRQDIWLILYQCVYNVADIPSQKLGICAKLLRGLFTEVALRR